MAKCFVVMGFGTKTDYQSGRKLNLDASYQNLIKPAVVAAGLECVRADEIVHAGNINVPMYEQLLTAEVVVADVSTMNPNAFYELGVRHALKPFTTVIVAESELVFPFDIQQIVVRKYRHLGEDIGVTEATRFKAELTVAIQTIMAAPKDDSPVYTFLRLTPPSLIKEKIAANLAQPVPNSAANPKAETLRALLDVAEGARANGNWVVAKAMFQQVRQEMQKKTESGLSAVDPYILQQLALATYKADASVAGLKEAHAVLMELKPETSNDPETLGLWGAIHKRLWDRAEDRSALDEAVTAYERGFYIKNDYYNGINCAFVLDLRASVSTGDDAVADRVQANRIRSKVIPICDQLLKETEIKPADRYWALATLAEAWYGLGDKGRSEIFMQQAAAVAPESWMVGTTRDQLRKLDQFRGKGAIA